jgi:group II intron reverse transcriptase/maturase
MQTAETVLAVIHDRGQRGLPLEELYRQLFNPNLFLSAYARLYANQGAMTPGSNAETVDGMSQYKINNIINTLRYERYRWKPVKRVYIPKKNGKRRPLGLPTWSDKVVQEVIRALLQAYFEPTFSDHSHGFRPGRGPHTALSEIADQWKGTHWFIEGDISQCFDRLDREVMLTILHEKIHDNRFLRLLENMLKAGYLEDWKWHATLSGCPQGGVVSPALSNVYLDKLDKFVETELLPHYNRGKLRRPNPPYKALSRQIAQAKHRHDSKRVQALRKQRRHYPVSDPNDPNYRRLRYIRYADDFLLGFSGPKAEAEEIKLKIRDFLRNELKLELSEEKTLITHAITGAAKFLGYEIVSQHDDTKLDRRGWRGMNRTIGLRLPAQVVTNKSKPYLKKGQPAARPEMLHNSDYAIVTQYQAEYRGVVQYYLLAVNVYWLNRLHWLMETSLLKTLANKYRTTVSQIAHKYKATTQTPQGIRKCLKVVVEREEGKKPLQAIFGGIPLKRHKQAVMVDQNPAPFRTERSELLKRVLADKCELCESTQHIEVHHIRKLADLKQKGRKEKPRWVQLMAAKQRKTLVVCRSCHDLIHAGKIKAKVRE